MQPRWTSSKEFGMVAPFGPVFGLPQEQFCTHPSMRAAEVGDAGGLTREAYRAIIPSAE